MDIERAKQILEAIHRGQSAGDASEHDAACSLLETDGDLQQWFEAMAGERSEFDLSIAAKLRSHPVPEGPLDQIKSTVGSPPSPIARFLLPAAAAAALLVAGLFFLPQGDGGGEIEIAQAQRTGGTLEAFRSDMANFALSNFSLQHKGGSLPELTSWLGDHGGPTGKTLKGSLASSAGLGCAVVGWGKERVSLICFENAGGQVVHMFVVDRCAIDCAGIETLVAQNEMKRDLETAGWVDDEKVYLLVGAAPEVHLNTVL